MFPGPSPYPTHLSVSPWPSPSHSLKESKFNKQRKERQNNAHRNVAIEWMTLQQIPAGQLYSRQSLLFIYFFNLFWNWATCVWARSLQLCPTFGNPVDYSPWRSSVYGILQARKLEWLPFPPPADPPNPGMEPVSPASPALQADSLPLSHRESPFDNMYTPVQISPHSRYISWPLAPKMSLLSPFSWFYPTPDLPVPGNHWLAFNHYR